LHCRFFFLALSKSYSILFLLFGTCAGQPLTVPKITKRIKEYVEQYTEEYLETLEDSFFLELDDIVKAEHLRSLAYNALTKAFTAGKVGVIAKANAKGADKKPPKLAVIRTIALAEAASLFDTENFYVENLRRACGKLAPCFPK
jgi:hypothetical protein